MAPQNPSIQSFFSSSKPTNPPSSPSSAIPGDGFTPQEVDAVLLPTIDESWMPAQEYEEVEIASLIPGPRCVTLQGRIANFYDQATPSKKPRAAKGCVKVIIKDESGAVTVRLWYANMAYHLRLGQLVSLWTPHVSNGEHGTLSSAQAPLFTSIFPERDRSCHFMIHENSDNGEKCKKPLGYRNGQALPGLMTLKNFIDGGYDVTDGRILVCVKSIGAKKKITNKKNVSSELISVNVFDDTSDATLTLWDTAIASATTWKPSHTILLITNPGWRIDKRAYINCTANTLIDVDPTMPDADWLRNFAQRMIRREHVNPPFPYTTFDFAIMSTAVNQILYTFADIDEFARAAPSGQFFGYISVVIMELNIMTLYRRNMLLCNEHCGHPIYADTVTTKCKQCDKPVTLNINPKVLGAVVDETGCSTAGKVLLSEQAWAELLGRTKEELVGSNVEVLKYLEQRLLFLRVTLRFAWAAEEGEGGMGRLCIWGVKM
ncbi:hypothetical protein EJ08DRAFT_131912 [Tothia fuscella]|uniref:PAS domain-containing protein n=1 Tax=Tothia fuscella TaxID=1048955 RepID=A0A9P4NWD0_9PEZI|nr:hypothetical protein EJ08DRAFT_131912 [Tothia fuscella]